MERLRLEALNHEERYVLDLREIRLAEEQRRMELYRQKLERIEAIINAEGRSPGLFAYGRASHNGRARVPSPGRATLAPS